MGTSLWIVPDAQDTERLKTIMRTRQSERPNHPSSYPSFHPHITLASFPTTSPPPPLSEIRAALDSALVQNQRHRREPVQIDFASVDIGTHFYRSVYVSVSRSLELVRFHAAVHAKLGIEPRTPVYPHLSLCYIADADADERGRFLRELEVSGRIRYERDGDGDGDGYGYGRRVRLGCGLEGGGEGGDWDWVGGFVAREVWVAKCDGPVESWSVLDKISIV